MDSNQVVAYLRCACSVLDFDIGELWTARRNSGEKPTLNFIQLYTSPTYEDFHSLLIRPDNIQNQDTSKDSHDEEKHRISPIICRGVCDGGQIVWASTLISSGLTGRVDLPLNTAVGLPICSVGSDLCIMVLFAVESIKISPNAIDFLCYLARAASEKVVAFLPASFSAPVYPANAEQFVGVWDMMELIQKYSHDISFHILPMGKLQSFSDYQEIMAFRDIFQDFKSTRQSGFSSKLLEALKTDTIIIDESIDLDNASETDLYNYNFQPGAFITEIDSSVDSDSFSSKFGSLSYDDTGSNPENYKIFSGVDARDSYKKSSYRFHEFMVALLGMTVFDAAELWMLSDKTNELYLVAALYRDGIMQTWTSHGRNIRLKKGQDVPGQIYETSRSYWDNRYNSHGQDSINYPRSQYAIDIGVKTAFGVPLPSATRGTSGSLVLYSRISVDVEPLIATFVLKAAQIISASSVDSNIVSSIDIENLVHSPAGIVSEWVSSKIESSSLMLWPIVPNKDDSIIASANIPDISLQFQLMGSLSDHCPNSRKRKNSLSLMSSESIDVFCKPSNYFSSYSSYEDFPITDEESNGFNEKSFIATKCSLDGCNFNTTSNKSVYCSDHAVSRRCQKEGCNKCAQGATKYCISHGGGRRCTYPGCMKGARDKYFCAAHGGGKRCIVESCSKSAVGGSSYCTLHGGGKRCAVEGCTKSSQSSTKYCVKHGGGRKCLVEGCTKVSRGRTDYCAAHGGGIRCKIPQCQKSAVGKNQLCRSHQNDLMGQTNPIAIK